MQKASRYVLTLIVREIRASLRSARRRDLAWVFGGGGLLLAYAFGILVNGTVVRADMLRETAWVWSAAVPGAMLASGASLGLFFGRLAQARAWSPFLKALPLSDAERRRSALHAALILGTPLVVIDGGLVGLLAALVGKPSPLLWLAIGVVMSGATFSAAVVVALRRPYRSPEQRIADPPIPAEAGTQSSKADGRSWIPAFAGMSGRGLGLSIRWLDRRRPAWIASWASQHPGGRLPFSFRGLGVTLLFALAGLGAVTMSFVRQTAGAGVVAGVVGGALIFMLALRCHPLLSPILRASRLPFWRAWLGLMRLPLALSAGFFAFTALPAYAAEPSAWEMPVAGMMGLVILNLVYAVFAAFFAAAPRLAAFAFFAALALTAYETLEYGRTVVLGLLALLLFLFFRTRRSYRHG